MKPLLAPVARIEGYASIFNTPDRAGDIVARGAFRRTIRPANARSIRMLYQHAPEIPCGRWTHFEEDARGLWVEGEVLLTNFAGAELYQRLAQDAIDGLSIGYEVKRAEKYPRGRLILEADLWEISVVTFPMAPGARIAAVGCPEIPDRRDGAADGSTLASALKSAATVLSA